MGCIITFTGPSGTILTKDSGLSSRQFQDIKPELIFKDLNTLVDYFGNEYKGELKNGFSEYDIFAYLLLKNLNSSTIDAIEAAYSEDKTVAVSNNKDIVPNTTIEELQSNPRFNKKLDFPPNTPPILLVAPNPFVAKNEIKKIVLENKYGDLEISYIVPDTERALFAYANFCYRLRAVEMLRENSDDSEFIESLGLLNLYLRVISEYNNRERSAKRSLATTLEEHIKSIKTNLENELNGYTDKQGESHSSIRQKILDLLNIITKYSEKKSKARKQSTADEYEGTISRAEAALAKYKARLEEIKELLKAIKDGTYSDEFVSKELRKVEDIIAIKSISRNAVDLLDDFVHNQEKYKLFLNPEMITELTAVLDRIVGRQRIYDNKDPFIQEINYLLTTSNFNTNPEKRLTLNKKFLFDTFQKHGWIPSSTKYKNVKNGELKAILEEKYLKHLDTYELLPYYTDGNVFRLKYSPREELFKLHADEFDGDVRSFSIFEANKNNYTRYKGYYIYGINHNNPDGTTSIKWYATNRILNEYSNPLPFRTKELALGYVDLLLEKNNTLDDLLFLNQVGEGITLMEIPERTNLRKREIMTIIDYPVGNISTKNITTQDFNTWLEATMTTKIKTEIISKKLLDSKLKMAMFYSHYGYLKPMQVGINSTLESEILKLLNDIQKETYCYIISDSFKDHKHNYVRGVRVSYLDITELTPINGKLYYAPDLIVLKTIVDTLADKGVPIKLINQEDFDKVLQEKNVPVEDREKAKGIYHNGMIFINLQKAVSTDPLHEYTHILLGILKNNNLKGYEDLLLQLVATEYGLSRLAEIQERYPNLSELALYEELFADLYAEFLLGENLKDLNDLFEYSTERIKNEDSIFDLNNGIIKIKENPTVGDLFSRFCSLVRYSQRKSGFSLPIGDALYSATRGFIEANMARVKDVNEKPDKIIKEICD